MKFVIKLALLISLGIGFGYAVDHGVSLVHADGSLAQTAGHPYRPLYAMADATAVSDAGSVPDADGTVAAPTVPDPLGHPGDTVSTVSKLYHSGAWVPLTIVLAFILLLVITKETSWLQQGKRAAYAAAVLGALTILVVPASQGATPSLAMIVSALGAAIALIVNPAKAPS